MRSARLRALAWLTLAFVAAMGVDAGAGLVTDVKAVVTQTGDVYRYDYTLTNAPDSTLGASSLFLTVGQNAGLFGIMAPTGWDVFYNDGDPTIEFSSSAALMDIAPGTFGLFSISSRVGPRSNDYLVRGIDDLGGTFVDNTGLVLTPSFVPEPSSFLLAAIGAGGLVVGRWRMRRRS